MSIISAAPQAHSDAWEAVAALLSVLSDPKGVANELARLKAAAEDAKYAQNAAVAERRDVERLRTEVRDMRDSAISMVEKAKEEAAEILKDANRKAEKEVRRRVHQAMASMKD
jgi:F0F1-type ATP synthase membrane subunit b/b'